MNRYLLLLFSVIVTLVVVVTLWWALTSRAEIEPAQGGETVKVRVPNG